MRPETHTYGGTVFNRPVDRFRDLHYRLFSQNKHSAFDTVIGDLYTIVHMSLL